jgi:hypothetical protein
MSFSAACKATSVLVVFVRAEARTLQENSRLGQESDTSGTKALIAVASYGPTNLSRRAVEVVP